MNILSSVRIEGLFGDSRPIDLAIDDKFNFFIGPNGTGKTTIINLLAATLLADFQKLDRATFSKIEIRLKEVGGRKRPSIVVEKKLKPGLPFYDIAYTIKLSSTETLQYDLDAYEEEMHMRGMSHNLLRSRFASKRNMDIREQLKSMVTTIWLSVHRVSEIRKVDDQKYASSVDQKLNDLNNELVRFFSKVSKQFAEHTAEFQKKSFLALIDNSGSGQLFKFVKKINLEEEKLALEKVFETLGVQPQHYAKLLKEHTRNLSKAAMQTAEGPVTLDMLSSMYNAWRAHSLIQSYKVLQERKAEIFMLRDSFIKLLGVMFAPRKTVEITQKNELLFRSLDGSEVEPQNLSSGEKQLLIILGEALLQESAPVVYIADEPELSLHVKWQEQLTGAITFLNPAAQIIFATHSPDIVNVHTDKIINMEKV